MMNRITILLLLVFVLLGHRVAGQVRVYQHAGEVLDTVALEQGIQRIVLPWGHWGKHVVAVLNEGEREYHKTEIWGVRLSDGTRLRFFRGNTYQVLETAPIVIYQTYSPHPVYYFSKDLSSNLRVLRYNELKKRLDPQTFVAAFRQSPIVREYVFLE